MLKIQFSLRVGWDSRYDLVFYNYIDTSIIFFSGIIYYLTMASQRDGHH
jgi:hypothetical protein